MEYTGLYNQNFRLWLESKEYIYGMVEPRKMHRFEPDLDDDQRSLDRIKTDELDAFRIAIYCEQNHKKILRNPSKLPSPVYFKLKRLLLFESNGSHFLFCLPIANILRTSLNLTAFNALRFVSESCLPPNLRL
jgi:hypothetical protein